MEVNHDGSKFIPHVIEVAYGIDRPLICVLESCIKEEKDRLFFTFPSHVSPYQIGVFPLVRKEGLPEIAQKVYQKLKTQFYSLYDETGSIGKMYYRQDEAGTSYCITIDFDTKNDNTVTLRDRDTQKQVRIKIGDLVDSINKLISGEKIEKVGKLVKK